MFVSRNAAPAKSGLNGLKAGLGACVAALALVSATIIATPEPAAAQALKKIKVTIPVPAFGFYPLYAGVDQGFFAKEGYDVEIISTAGDGPDVDALIAGSVQFSLSTPNRLFTAHEQGKTLLAVMTTTNRLGIECIINKAFAERKGLKPDSPLADTLQALKGQTIAGTRPGAFTYLTAALYASRAKLEAQKDVKIIGVGGPGSMIAALENEQVVFACTASPTPEMAEARGKAYQVTKNLAGGDASTDDFMYQILYVRPDFAQQNPEVVRGIIRGLAKAIAYIKETPGAAQLPAIRKHFPGVPDDVALVMLENNKPAYKADGFTTQRSVERSAAFLKDAGVLKSSAVDWTAIVSNQYLPKQ
jgi:NitT/TauT family transport system substrate-binding protein